MRANPSSSRSQSRLLAPAVLALALFALTPLARGAEFVATWGPAIGSTAPAVAATDQDGTPRTLANLAGDRGLLLVFFRSADW